MSDDDDLFGGTGETRTRLPERDGADGYGPARRSGRSAGRSPSRSVVTVVGVVVLLIAAIAFANRGGSSSDDGGDGGRGGGKGPEAASTAASGEKPVSGGTGGIPSGFPKNQQGVESATANYAVVLGSTGMFDTARRHAIVDTVYTPNAAAQRKPALDKVYSGESFLSRIGLQKDGTPPKGTTFVSRIIPVGTKVTKFEGESATVEIWYSSLFGLAGENTENPVTESWFTNTYDMRWSGGDWKVADFKQKDGPVPVGRDQRASTADDMAKAVEEYGGFTYAR
ncbi:hypothetical protein [Streptomyces sp. NPDC017941]|uniref:hypothetical protein n=1 Tax=Streptomyces sp. NPDC017941 TaxID=3365018 RepID=UPI00378B1BE9